ncbi:MAG: hypothetical protein IPK17_34825 [Chloroflexi bacterium]|uniref:hypothetical protein n=1 Tax=Candidatus Flexifilum breve TaxID=3140694 RepID=UPI003136AFC0|nr:hypothetical protein [Chloroflexota bacterium]
MQENDYASVVLFGETNGHLIRETLTLRRDSDHVHVEVSVTLAGSPPRLEYILSPFVFAVAAEPEFIHSPSLKFADDDVIGDRVFESPAVILQHQACFMALVPDLDFINQYAVIALEARQVATGNAFSVPYDRNQVTMPVALDLLMHSGLTSQPLAAYGIIDSIATHHMHWRHPSDGSMVRTLATDTVRYAFDLFISAEAPRYRGYQRITRYLWERYGGRYFRQPRPQAMPFNDYAKICYPASFAYLGSDVVLEAGERMAAHQAPAGYPDLPSWLEWELDGVRVGGYRNNAPQWYDLIGNTMFWNNVRDAVALYWWRQRLHDEDLLDKARCGLNLALAAPQHEGLFPTIYRFQDQRWQNNHWEPPLALDPQRTGLLCERYFNDYSESYHTASMSKTAAHLLRYMRLCEADPRILPYVRRYADFIVTHLDENGCLPAWFSPSLRPNAHLRFNGESGVHVWFLAELYQVTREETYLNAAKRLASFIAQELLPRQRWLDTECYFSCGSKAMDFHDAYQQQEPRGSLAMIWSAEGFAALYRATADQSYLKLGEQVLDYALFFQAVWQPHYIVTAYAFGGWNTDNGDAAWLDARQGEFADILIYYGMALGRQDLIERGVASARAGLTLINHSRHIENDIYAFPNFPLGLGPENIDHEGFPQSTMRTDASWGEVAGLCGAADVMRQLGGVYLDAEKNLAVGVDGVVLSGTSISDGTIRISLANSLNNLPMAYSETFSVQLRVVGLADGWYEIIINDTAQGSVSLPINSLPVCLTFIGIRYLLTMPRLSRPSAIDRRKQVVLPWLMIAIAEVVTAR